MSTMTPQMIVHRNEAERLTDCCWEALRNHGRDSIQHKQTVAALDAHTAKADPSWHCAVVDPDLWSHFSDFHKDLYNFRPQGHFTAAEVRKKVDRMSEAALE